MAETFLGNIAEKYTKEAINTAVNLVNESVFYKKIEQRKKLDETLDKDLSVYSGRQLKEETMKKGKAYVLAGTYDSVREECKAVQKAMTTPIKDAAAQVAGTVTDNIVKTSVSEVSKIKDAIVAKMLLGLVLNEDQNIIRDATLENPKAGYRISEMNLHAVLDQLKIGVDSDIAQDEVQMIAYLGQSSVDLHDAYLKSLNTGDFFNRTAGEAFIKDHIGEFENLYYNEHFAKRFGYYEAIATAANEEASVTDLITQCFDNIVNQIGQLKDRFVEFINDKETQGHLAESTKSTLLNAIPQAAYKLVTTAISVAVTSNIVYGAISFIDKKIGVKKDDPLQYMTAYRTYDRIDQMYKNFLKRKVPDLIVGANEKKTIGKRLKHNFEHAGIHAWNTAITVLKAPVSVTEKIVIGSAKKICEKKLKGTGIPLITYKSGDLNQQKEGTIVHSFFKKTKRPLTAKELAYAQAVEHDVDAILNTIPGRIKSRIQNARNESNQYKNPFKKIVSFSNTMKEGKSLLNQLESDIRDSILPKETWEHRLDEKLAEVLIDPSAPDFHYDPANHSMHSQLAPDVYLKVTNDGYEITKGDGSDIKIDDVTDHKVKGYLLRLLSSEYEAGVELGNPVLQYKHADLLNTLEKDQIWQDKKEAMLKHHIGYNFELRTDRNSKDQNITFKKNGKELLDLPVKMLIADAFKTETIRIEDLHVRSVENVIKALDKGIIRQNMDCFYGRPDERTIRIDQPHVIEIDHLSDHGNKYRLHLDTGDIEISRPGNTNIIETSIDSLTLSIQAGKESIHMVKNQQPDMDRYNVCLGFSR